MIEILINFICIDNQIIKLLEYQECKKTIESDLTSMVIQILFQKCLQNTKRVVAFEKERLSLRFTCCIHNKKINVF
jgi:hypothetical protein